MDAGLTGLPAFALSVAKGLLIETWTRHLGAIQYRSLISSLVDEPGVDRVFGKYREEQRCATRADGSSPAIAYPVRAAGWRSVVDFQWTAGVAKCP